MGKTITEAQRLQLLGLLTLAASHHRMMTGLEKAAREITGEEEGGLAGDMIWCGETEVDELLQKCGITVIDPTNA